jgi:hypothetical protein
MRGIPEIAEVELSSGIEDKNCTICFAFIVRLRFTAKNFSVIIENVRNGKRLDDYTTGIENSDA